MTSLLIHAPVSVAQSLRTSLSNELWRFGPGIFDIAGVPFASSTGKDRAYRLCRLLKFFAENDHGTFSSMTEYGVGSGILSWHVLTLLRQHFPDIYDQIQIRLTDGSIDLLEQLLVQRHWSSHRHKVSAHAVFEKRLARLTPEDPMQTVLKYHRRLPLYERVNHHVLGRLAVFAFKREAWKVSIYYTKKSLEGYRHVAARAYFRIGLCYQEMGQHSKALVNFKKFIKMAPYLKDPYWELMQYYFSQKNHKAVLSALKKCIRYSQDNEVWPLYIALAQAYLKDGKTQQAHRILRRIQDLDKSHPGHIPDSVLRSIPS